MTGARTRNSLVSFSRLAFLVGTFMPRSQLAEIKKLNHRSRKPIYYNLVA